MFHKPARVQLVSSLSFRPLSILFILVFLAIPISPIPASARQTDVPLEKALVLSGGESTNPRDYDPATTFGSADKLAFSGLVSFDPKLNLTPDLAEAWDVGDDHLVMLGERGEDWCPHGAAALDPAMEQQQGRPVAGFDDGGGCVVDVDGPRGGGHPGEHPLSMEKACSQWAVRSVTSDQR